MTDLVQLPSGLVIPEAAFMEAVAARPELGEVATTLDGRDITRGFVNGLPLLPPTDTVLAARGAYDYRIYDEVLRDDQVAATLQQRRLAVVSREWEVRPGGDKRRDKQAAEFIGQTLKHIRWDAVTDRMLYGVFYGYAVAECLWKRDGQRITLDALKVRDRRRFGFRPVGDLVLKTTRNPDGEDLPARKFWHFATGASHDDEPYGLGLAHWLYWPVLFKRNGIKFWLIFLEKFGMPTGVGKFPSNATPAERSKLLAAVQAIQADSGVIIPDGMALELLEAARSGTADYGAMCARMDAAISKVVLGHSAGADSTPGRLGGEDNAMDVRQDLVKADADLVCDSANRSWVRWLVDWNFPGAAYPEIWRRIEDEPDLKPQAERDQIIHGMGFQPSEEYIRETYGDGWTKKEPPAGPPPAPPGQEGQPPQHPGGVPAFAAGESPAGVDGFIDRLQRDAQPPIDDMLGRIRQLLDEVDSLAAFSDRLAEAYAYLPPEELASVMQFGLAAADLAGRYEASEEQ